MSDRIARIIGPLLVLLVLTGIWEAWVHLSDTPRWMLPAPSDIVESFRADYRLLATHTWVTLQEVVIGFAIALVTGLLTGVAIDSSRIVERALYPLLIASQTIPMVVLAPLFLIWFGYGLLPKVLITALVAYFPLAVNTVDGLKSTDRELLRLLRSMGATRWQVFRLARVPSALPHIFGGARISVAFSVIGAVFGEFVGARAGLGYLMDRSAPQFETPRVFACIVILALMGVSLFLLVSLAERLALPWRRYVSES
jgi:ABC-type nitrate/sulfonate/bicarbonate transport system permease component